jgi:uncharacterized protein
VSTSPSTTPEPSPVTCEVPVSEILRRLGERRPLRRELSLVGLRVGAVEVPETAAIVIDGTIESVREGVLVDATIRAPWVGECRRCLDPVDGNLEIKSRELFERTSTPGESYPLVGERVDLVAMVTDAVLLSLPLAPLCSDDCRGPDPERFPAEPAPDDVEVAPSDPRWAALADVAFDLRDIAAEAAAADDANDAEAFAADDTTDRG